VNSGIVSGTPTQTAFLFSFTTSVAIPANGKIVIEFPIYDTDGTT
jgi:hypothetical protein